MSRKSILNILYLLVFLFSSALRLRLAIVNRDPNDVVEMILWQDRLPLTGECEECFQPKLFYFVSAAAVQISGINLDHPGSVTLTVQLVNFLAGEMILLLAYFLIKCLDTSQDKAGLIAFALLAFNPTLIAASGTTINDTFAILFSSAAIFFCWKFLRSGKIVNLVLSGILVSLGLATKTNVWSTTIAIFLALSIKAIKEKKIVSGVTGLLFILVVSLATMLDPLSQYLVNLQKFGTPLTLNVPPEPFPSLFDKTYVRRPGIVSIQDGFFTLKFISLLEYPRQTLGATDYPAFRTALWPNLYGSANSLHFLNSPDSWHTKPDFETTRSIFILALVPTSLFLFGVARSAHSLIEGFRPNSGDLIKQRSYGLFDIVLAGYILSIIALALRYRDFSTMKAIYIFPAVPAFVALFLEGIHPFYGLLLRQKRWVTNLFEAALLFLIVVYAADVNHMITHLANINLR